MLNFFKKKEIKLDSFNLGTWEVTANQPFGFVVKNISPSGVKVEYHFLHDSIGWMTAVVKRKKETYTAVLNETGKIGGQAILVDKESSEKFARFIQLQKKGKSLTEQEMKELLTLMGVMGG